MIDNASMFIVLRLFLLATLLATGYLVSRKSLVIPFWVMLIPVVIAYSMIEGLRFGRGTDYMHYRCLYENAYNMNACYDASRVEALFKFLNMAMRGLDVGSANVFVVYSFVLIVAAAYFSATYRYDNGFVLFLFFCATISQSDNLIKQFMAFSFILFSLPWLYKKQWMKFCCALIVACLFHKSAIFILPFLILTGIYAEKISNAKWGLFAIIGAFLLSWLWKPEYWANYSIYFRLLNTGSYYQVYVDNADTWFSGEQLMGYSFSVLAQVRIFLFNILLLWGGWLIMKERSVRKFTIPYLLFVIGAVTQRITWDMELLYRISLYFYMFWFVVAAFVIHDFLFERKTYIYTMAAVIVVAQIIYEISWPLFDLTESKTLFVWNVP